MKPLLETVFARTEQSFDSPEIALDLRPPRVDMADVLSLLTHSLTQSTQDNDRFHRQLREEASRLGEEAREGEKSPETHAALSSAAATIATLIDAKEQRDELRIETLARQIEALRAELREARTQAQTDPLTGVLNRGSFDAALEELVDRHREESSGVALLLFDIDDFKRVNDRYGHQVGDEAIRVFTRRCRSQLRPSDRLARYGGEEFAVLIEGVSLEHAAARAESIRAAIADAPCKVGRNGATRQFELTVSAGVSSLATGDEAEDLVHRADEALYLAKARGKNCVMSEHDLLH